MNPTDPPSDPVDEPGSAGEGVETTPRLGASTFTIEGRAAPGLFVVGWLATLLGLAAILTAILAGDPDVGRILLIVGMALLALGLVAAAGSQGIERRAKGRLPYQGPSPFLVLAASVPVAVLALFLISLPFAVADVPLDGPFGALLSVTVQAFVYIGLVRLLVVDGGALDWRSMGWSRFDPSAVAAALGGALWAVPVVLITALLAAVLVSAIPVEPVSPLPPSGTTFGFGLSLVAGAIVAPLGEELLFRGFATTAWIRGRGVVPGVILGAVVFAFAHIITISGATAGEAIGQAIVAFLGRLPVALALGWIFVRRRTIWAPFGLHAAFNAILLIIAESAAGAT